MDVVNEVAIVTGAVGDHARFIDGARYEKPLEYVERLAEHGAQMHARYRNAVGAATIHPALLTAPDRTQCEEYQRREEANAAIRSPAARL